MRFPTQSANDPYAPILACDNCGAKDYNRFIKCDDCRKRGCDRCMILNEDSAADIQTGYRDSFYLCGECCGINTEPKMLAPVADVYDDAEVTF
jgi:hypothetical protein